MEKPKKKIKKKKHTFTYKFKTNFFITTILKRLNYIKTEVFLSLGNFNLKLLRKLLPNSLKI